jgi:hypothetical protein
MEILMSNEINTILIHGERPDSTLVWDQTISPHISNDNLIIYFLLSPHLIPKYFKHRDFIKNKTAGNRFRVRLLYTVIPNRLFFKGILFFSFSLFISKVILLWIFYNKKVYAHSRGFLGAAALSQTNFKFTYDPRSDYISELVTLKLIKVNCRFEKKLISLERVILERATKVVGVNPEHRELLITRGALPEKTFINRFSISNYKFLQPRPLKNTRCIAICYIGSIDVEYWNDVRVYLEYIKCIDPSLNVTLTIYSQTISPDVRSYLNGVVNINIRHDTFNEQTFASKMMNQDIGIMFMPKLPDSATRFGVKAAEYICASLPVLCNRNVGSLSSYVDRYKCGVVINKPSQINSALKEIVDNFEYYSRNSHVSREEFRQRND